jgi:hypothetical protein
MNITVKLQGGLGNQLFQLAFLEYVSQLNNALPYIEDTTSRISCHSFNNYFETIFSNWKCLEKNIQSEKNLYEVNLEPCDWNICESSNIRVIGYFQNYNYISDSFVNKLRFSEKILSRYPNIESKVFIHIRGRDYLIGGCEVHNVQLDEYYNAAIKLFDKNTEFIIFTNDKNYAMAKPFLGSIKYSFADENELDTLLLMSKCKGCICANSSFSWWGAYLNRTRKIILPSKWLNDVNIYQQGYYFDGCTIIDVTRN